MKRQVDVRCPPRKKAEKEGRLPACLRATHRQAGAARELPLWWKRALLPCGPLGRFWTMVMDGTARKSPFNPAAFAWAPLVVVHAVAFVGATLVVAHQATDAVGGRQSAGAPVGGNQTSLLRK